MRFMIGFAMPATLAITLAATLAAAAHAEGPGLVPDLAPFKAVELRHDGVVEIRQGAVQSVTLVAGDRWPGGFTVEDGRLVINGCKGCGERFRVVIVTPAIEAVAATGEGGLVTLGQGFAPQPQAALSASGGGVVRAVNLTAGAVVASVHDAGRIEAGPAASLVASASGAGEILYHGQPKVVSSVTGKGEVRPAG
jgi:hypothetical protein